jgi:hypothetical protein
MISFSIRSNNLISGVFSCTLSRHALGPPTSLHRQGSFLENPIRLLLRIHSIGTSGFFIPNAFNIVEYFQMQMQTQVVAISSLFLQRTQARHANTHIQ